MDRYNLLDKDWIPVLFANGEFNRVGIKKALEQSNRIRQIAATNPMDRIAIIRLLLALLYWCKGNPPGLPANKGESFPLEWFSKLDENRECFNLLGNGKRFYQYRKDHDKKLSANYLIHEIPTGTNFWHFHHSTDEADGLCPACCALGLVRLPIFSTSGGKGKSPGINAKPPIYVIPFSKSLAETLWLSWRPSSSVLGTPAWERPDLPLPGEGNVPLLTGLTWLPRRVWLGEPREPVARCISCGRQDYVIPSSIFAGKGSIKTDDSNPRRIWHDPHVIYEETKKGDVASLHSTNALGNADAGAGQWAKITAGILRQTWNDISGAWVVGFSTVQNDKYLEATEYTIRWPGSQDQTKASIEMVEQWQRESAGLAYQMKPLGEKISSRKDQVEITSMLAAIRPHVEDKVSGNIEELLTAGNEAWKKAVDEYAPMLKAVAKSLSPGFTVAALERRGQITGARLDMAKK